MDRRSALRQLLVAGAFPFLSRADQTGAPGYTLRSEVRLVLLDVSVRDGRGGFVGGLSAENFRVLDNGRPQPITSFDSGDEPVTMGLLMDNSLSMTSSRPAAITAALTLISESNPHDEVFIINFNDTVRRGLPDPVAFSDDIDQLRAALERGAPRGKTALYDAVIDGLEQLTLGRASKKTLVLISDGGDTASNRSRHEMVAAEERSLATIYTIGLLDPESPDLNPGVLTQLAKITGGEAFFPPDSAHLIPVCREVAREIRARYTLGYAPPDGSTAGSLRKIRVEVTAEGREKLVAHTRTSYRT